MSVVNSIFPNPSDDKENQVAEGFVVLIDGDTAPRAIASGQYLFIKNHSTLATGGYHATEAISSGSSITSSNVTADADGIANAIDEKVNTLSSKIGTVPTGTDVETQIGTLNNKMPTGNAFDEILIPAGSDINDYTTPGTFIVPNDSTAAQISNMPRSASGRLIVMNRTSSSYMVQEYYPTTVDPIKYVRNYNAGTWTNWDQIALNSKITITQYEQLTINAGFSAGKFAIGRYNKYRVAVGSLQPTNAGVNIAVLTLPAGDRPPIDIVGPCTGYLVSAQSEISIDSSGNVTLNVPSGGNNNTVKFNMSWLVN